MPNEGSHNMANAVVTCEIIFFHNYFSLRRRPPEIVLFQRVKTCLKFFQNFFRGLLRLMNIFQHVQHPGNNFRTLSAAEIILFQFQMWLHVK